MIDFPTMINFSYAVVIPTIGRPGLAELVATVDSDPAPACIVIADDRRSAATGLELPKTSAPLLIVGTHGRGPAAARNAGWQAADAEWIAFLDDDVKIPLDWCRRLVRDLSELPDQVAASQARLYVPPPVGRRALSEFRAKTGLGVILTSSLLTIPSPTLTTSGGSTFDPEM